MIRREILKTFISY